MVSRVQVEGIDQIPLLGFQGRIQGCFQSSFLPRNAWIRRWCSGVRILGPMSGDESMLGVQRFAWRGGNLFFCYALTTSLGIRPCE